MTVLAEEMRLKVYLNREEAAGLCTAKQELYQVPCGEVTFWVPARTSFQAVQAVTRHLGITPVKDRKQGLLPERFSIRPDPTAKPEGRSGHFYLLEDSLTGKSHRFLRPHLGTVRDVLMLFFGGENGQVIVG